MFGMYAAEQKINMQVTKWLHVDKRIWLQTLHYALKSLCLQSIINAKRYGFR